MQTATEQATPKRPRAKPSRFPSKTIPLGERESLSPTEYCVLHGIGRTTLYQMWKDGTGPEFFMVRSRRRIPRGALPKGANDV